VGCGITKHRKVVQRALGAVVQADPGHEGLERYLPMLQYISYAYIRNQRDAMRYFIFAHMLVVVLLSLTACGITYATIENS
jgi:hypothetical protein